ncbi:MAG: hypothetical protein Hyperionvirus3_51 [Hyperionvirus sp.]|uniref:Uncharacterized protein n=1 Tax=Hyperionvirus sp. TaxID=2487770 RepID=A0A3G5A6N9_9VIRU|nr:MAG: hypothetical protein Hyperionvirus3_51 [Hyperionvirus sp.]
MEIRATYDILCDRKQKLDYDNLSDKGNDNFNREWISRYNHLTAVNATMSQSSLIGSA